MTTEDTATPLAPRIALISIASFWAFYFAIWSVRGVVLYSHHQVSMLGTRAIVSLGSAAVTVVFYLLMRRVMATSLTRTIGLALVLALPAAVLYSGLNWYMFDHLGEGKSMRWSWSASPSTTAPTSPPPSVPGSMSVSVGMTPPGWSDDMTPLQAIADQAGNGYFFFIAWAALYLALCYAAEIGALERRTATLRAAAQSAELRALRYQVNPHFLFNTLNALSSLVLGGKSEQAEQMIINLATFFRTSLTGDPTEDVRLSEEINLQRLYLDIERVRFPDRLLVAIDVPDALLAVCIPGLILQPLVENAVKHAVSRSPRPITIRIAAHEVGAGLTLAVENDGDPVASERGEPGSGVGLRNVCDRLAARYGNAATCNWGPKPGGGFAVHLTLPLVRDGC
ncbi:histidine kinase [Sphingosinicellaceae bacterium]|nr:histidine kinase [Sphingosinicellaceae bacterium]